MTEQRPEPPVGDDSATGDASATPLGEAVADGASDDSLASPPDELDDAAPDALVVHKRPHPEGPTRTVTTTVTMTDPVTGATTTSTTTYTEPTPWSPVDSEHPRPVG